MIFSNPLMESSGLINTAPAKTTFLFTSAYLLSLFYLEIYYFKPLI